ncbi:uncharacterized protein MELLADRAFT_63451 [Melampsora larici-populina 98AG31]|uniref:Uncharacterized protein n=1 Tax=Melampsora larici-populina (strain 98AG31 / pathotype 3-4-7) TaxID=747676 RepID=F4RMP3_MELLP|nr:uncharacterized protein MELLADRAFT_63451 [Melampsora larici-populina 98AG31]EGG06345.1 hypothetical protein MELLADRAFT_63451 [Melampsora larici-populina 98AG31]
MQIIKSFICVNITALWWYSITTHTLVIKSVTARNPWGEFQSTNGAYRREVTDHLTLQDLETYLEKTLEERQDSEPFLSHQHPVFHDCPERDDYYELINSILKSKIEEWPGILKKIFKQYPLYQGIHFWRFIGQLSEFMSTPALQVTLFELNEQRQKDWNGYGSGDNFGLTRKFLESGWHEFIFLDQAISRCSDNMKKHVTSLKNNIKSQKIVDIFTQEAQEELREHKIQLEYKWPVLEQNELYRYWILYLELYSKVKADVKGMLETQSILTGMVKGGKMISLKTSSLPYELRQPLDNWLMKRANEVASKLVQYINLADEEWVKVLLTPNLIDWLTICPL